MSMATKVQRARKGRRPHEVHKSTITHGGPRRLSNPVYAGSIPRTDGPKLKAFPSRRAAINFRRLLSDPESEGQAHVFEVEIKKRLYALKIVS